MAVESPEALAPTLPADPPPVYTSPPPTARRRRARTVVWYLAVGIAIVVTLGAFGLLAQDDRSWQRQAQDLQRENSSLQAELLTTQTNAADAEQHVKDLQAAAQHPSLDIWNVPQKISGPEEYLVGGIPDTFTYHLVATATGPVSISILTFEQFSAALNCFYASGNANTCMHPSGAVKNFLNVNSINYDFHLAEGCAGYLDVWTAASSITVHPEVSVTYNPAPTFTGEC